MKIYIMFTFEDQMFVLNTSNFPVLSTDVRISYEMLVDINEIWGWNL